MPPVKVVVLGQAGDGKSTLIDSLRDKSKSEPPKRGKNPAGVTKSVLPYPGLPINGKDVVFFDTPGIGDMNVKVADVVKMLEDTMQQEKQLDGIIVTHKLTDCRLRLGAQFVQTIVQHGFVASGNPWAHVILVGTHRDRAETADLEHFQHQLAPLFFESNGGRGAAVMSDWHNYAQVAWAISTLPCVTAVEWRGAATTGIAKQLVEKMCEAELQQLRLKAQENEEKLCNLRAQCSSMECARQAETMRSDALIHIRREVLHATCCPYEHMLADLPVSNLAFKCNVCGTFQRAGEGCRSCSQCSFHVCGRCMRRRVSHINCVLPFEYQPSWFDHAAKTMETVSSLLRSVKGYMGRYLEIVDCNGVQMNPQCVAPDVFQSRFPRSFFITAPARPNCHGLFGQPSVLAVQSQ